MKTSMKIRVLAIATCIVFTAGILLAVRAMATVEPNNLVVDPVTCVDHNGLPTYLGNFCVPKQNSSCVENLCFSQN